MGGTARTSGPNTPRKLPLHTLDDSGMLLYTDNARPLLFLLLRFHSQLPTVYLDPSNQPFWSPASPLSPADSRIHRRTPPESFYMWSITCAAPLSRDHKSGGAEAVRTHWSHHRKLAGRPEQSRCRGR